MPSFLNTHSRPSIDPVEIATRGMLSTPLPPSSCRVGRRGRGRVPDDPSSVAGWQAVTEPTLIIRRHLPSWTTRGKDVPAGTSVSVNDPSKSVVVLTSGDPLAVWLH